MSYTGQNPRLTSNIFTDQTSGTVASPASSSVKTFIRNGHLYLRNSSGAEKRAGTGVAPGRNYLESWYDFANDPTSGLVTSLTATGNRTSNTTSWGASTTGLLAFNTSTAIRGASDATLTLTGASAAQFVESPMFTLDSADVGNSVYVIFDGKSSGTFASGDMDFVVIRYNSAGTYQATITPSPTQVPTGANNFKASFASSSTASDQYALRWRSQNASARTLDITFLAVGNLVTNIALYNPNSTTGTSGLVDGLNGLKAFSDGSSRATGYVGNIINKTVGSTALTAATWLDANFSTPGTVLDKGSWLALFNVYFSAGGTTFTDCTIGISTTTGNFATGLTNGINLSISAPTAGNDTSNMLVYQINANGTDTYYGKIKSRLSGGSPTYYASITFVRLP